MQIGRTSQEMQDFFPGSDMRQGSFGEQDIAGERNERPDGGEMMMQQPGSFGEQDIAGERNERPDGGEMMMQQPETEDGDSDLQDDMINTDAMMKSDKRGMNNGVKGERPAGERPEQPVGEEMTGEQPELPEGEQRGEMGPRDDRGRGMKGIDTENISAAIDELEDGDVKTNLETLLDDYEAARSALETAVSDEAEDIDTYRKDEMEAMKSLMEALDDAEIDTRPDMGTGEGEDVERPEPAEGETEGNMPGIGSNMNGNNNQQTAHAPADQGNKGRLADSGSAIRPGDKSLDQFLERIGNWFKALFSK